LVRQAIQMSVGAYVYVCTIKPVDVVNHGSSLFFSHSHLPQLANCIGRNMNLKPQRFSSFLNFYSVYCPSSIHIFMQTRYYWTRIENSIANSRSLGIDWPQMPFLESELNCTIKAATVQRERKVPCKNMG